MYSKPKKYYSQKEALAKLQRYCAYQERCHHEVKEKLSGFGIWGDWADQIIVRLIEENFLNEERYAGCIVRGKFKYKKWGRIKIIQRLKEKRISPNLIRLSLKEISEEDYLATLQLLIEKKDDSLHLKETDPFKRKQKIAKYLQQKGYESPLIWEYLAMHFQ